MDGALEVPAGLAGAGLADGLAPARAAWLAELPGAVDAARRRWGLDVGRPFLPGGTSAWVAPVRDTAGRRLVLKVGWRHDEALHEAEGLALWDGAGAVRLEASAVLGASSALLLEACEPGTSLAASLDPADQDVVLAGLLRRLWVPAPAGTPLRPLEAMCREWVRGSEAARATSAARGAAVPLDPGLVRAGTALFVELAATAEEVVVLATDLHAHNVLAARREPWLAIDPKPYVGDPAYDLLQHLLNSTDRLVADPWALVRRTAGVCGVDAGRLGQWLFARCVVGSVWQPHLAAVAERTAP